MQEAIKKYHAGTEKCGKFFSKFLIFAIQNLAAEN